MESSIDYYFNTASHPAILIWCTARHILDYYGEKESHMPEIEVGKVSDYFARPMVAGVDLIRGLKAGSRIHILGHTTDIEMDVASMQIDHQSVAEARPGDSVGIKVPDRVRPGDTVYEVMP